MNFVAARVFLISIDQHLFAAEGKKRDISAFEEAFPTGFEHFTIDKSSYVIDPIFDPHTKRLLGGKLGKQSRRRMPVLVGDHLDKTSFDLHPYLIFLWLRDSQLLVFQKNASVFPSALRPFNILESYVNRRLFNQGLEIKINPLTEENFFWDTIGRADRIYEVSFSFPAPNFFGTSEKETKEILDAIVADTNATVVDSSVKNEQGLITIDKNGRAQHAVRLTERGGGNWSVKVSLKGDRQLKRVRSRDKVKQVSLDIAWDDSNAEDYKKISVEINRRIS
jgi:hypothetical protein